MVDLSSQDKARLDISRIKRFQELLGIDPQITIGVFRDRAELIFSCQNHEQLQHLTVKAADLQREAWPVLAVRTISIWLDDKPVWSASAYQRNNI